MCFQRAAYSISMAHVLVATTMKVPTGICFYCLTNHVLNMMTSTNIPILSWRWAGTSVKIFVPMHTQKKSGITVPMLCFITM